MLVVHARMWGDVMFCAIFSGLSFFAAAGALAQADSAATSAVVEGGESLDSAVVEQAQDPDLASAVHEATAQTSDSIANTNTPESTGAKADGSRLVLEERGFSIQPPVGWEVYTDYPNLSLFMQIPTSPGLLYRRTIQVATFNGYRYIDELTAKEFEALIVKKFGAITASVEDFRVRNHMNIELADGRAALLFYSEMKVDGVDLMQAHILASSTDRHYLLTYTDVREHFEDDAASAKYLAEAWDAMVSIELVGTTPTRLESLSRIGIVIAGIVLFFALIWVIRQWRARRALVDYAQGIGDGEMAKTGSSHGSGFSTSSIFRSIPMKATSHKRGKKAKVKAQDESSQPPSSMAFSKPPLTGKSVLTTGVNTHHSSAQLPSQLPSNVSAAGVSAFDDDDQAA